jgi:archaeosortase B (VPXXXP-CTERM-specific)
MAKRRPKEGEGRGTSASPRKGAPRGNDARLLSRTVGSAFVGKARENSEVIKYVSFFLSLCILFYLTYYSLLVSGSEAMARLREFTASVLGIIFSVAGAEVVVNGALVSIDGFSLEIIDECTAVFSSIVYSACILAYPTTIRKKGIGVALGIPALYAINILRLVILAQVGLTRPALFEFVHVYLWQASFIIFVVVIFLLWLKFVVKE